MSLASLFDSYGRKAHLQPALLVLVPVIVLGVVWLPNYREVGTLIMSIAASCGVVALLGHIARYCGRTCEATLIAVWGGKPTAIWLRGDNSRLDPVTKARYYAYFSSHIAGWQAPNVDSARSKEADDIYDAAVRWLIEHTRDTRKFPLVFKELVGYGFRRNLYGLRPIGLTVAGVSVTVAVSLLGWQMLSLGHISAAAVLPLLGSVLFLIIWLKLISPDWVRDAGDAYARALLAVCDTDLIPKARKQRVTKRSGA